MKIKNSAWQSQAESKRRWIQSIEKLLNGESFRDLEFLLWHNRIRLELDGLDLGGHAGAAGFQVHHHMVPAGVEVNAGAPGDLNHFA
jgi:hypothetical protein